MMSVSRSNFGGGGDSGDAPGTQNRSLKQINNLASKEEVLEHVALHHPTLDLLAMAACMQRMARMYNNLQPMEHKTPWRTEVISDPRFLLLMYTLQERLHCAQQQLSAGLAIEGMSARCVSNLLWALVKLEVVGDAFPAGEEAVQLATPLVMHYLEECSGQHLSNLLWSYARLPTPNMEVLCAVIDRMSRLLAEPQKPGEAFDAQALSNSMWAIAHCRARGVPLDVHSAQVTTFLLCLVGQASNMLHSLNEQQQEQQQQQSLLQAHLAAASTMRGNTSAAIMAKEQEKKFSCQAMVNIAWSLASILGSACSTHPSILALFMLIKQEAIARLQTTATGLQLNQSWVYRMTGGFNAQALSNIVYAFDRAGALDAVLLQCVFDVAALRLGQVVVPSPGGPRTSRMTPLGFKPQELCTLLRACHQGLAQPWMFLRQLAAAVEAQPHATAMWTSSELAELHRALMLLRTSNQADGFTASASSPAAVLLHQQQQAFNMNAGVLGGARAAANLQQPHHKNLNMVMSAYGNTSGSQVVLQQNHLLSAAAGANVGQQVQVVSAAQQQQQGPSMFLVVDAQGNTVLLPCNGANNHHNNNHNHNNNNALTIANNLYGGQSLMAALQQQQQQQQNSMNATTAGMPVVLQPYQLTTRNLNSLNNLHSVLNGSMQSPLSGQGNTASGGGLQQQEWWLLDSGESTSTVWSQQGFADAMQQPQQQQQPANQVQQQFWADTMLRF